MAKITRVKANWMLDFERWAGKRLETVSRTELKSWETSRCGGNYKNAKQIDSYGPLISDKRLRWPTWLCEECSIGRNKFSLPWDDLDLWKIEEEARIQKEIDDAQAKAASMAKLAQTAPAAGAETPEPQLVTTNGEAADEIDDGEDLTDGDDDTNEAD